MDSISPLPGIPATTWTDATPVADQAAPNRATFATILKDQLHGANLEQIRADGAIQDLAIGKSDNVHETVMSVVQADLSLRMILEIRNRLIESYQEIMRMQI